MHYAYCLHSYIHLYLVVIINVTNSIIDHFLDLKECWVLILKKKRKKRMSSSPFTKWLKCNVYKIMILCFCIYWYFVYAK